MGAEISPCLGRAKPLTFGQAREVFFGSSGRGLMVTGFNTDIKHEGVVYHVQTEPRKDAGIETTVYMRGAVIHSVKTPYQDFLNSPDYSDEKFKRLLEDQHRQVIARIRAGEIRPPNPSAPGT
jgi:hypothetical protein